MRHLQAFPFSLRAIPARPHHCACCCTDFPALLLLLLKLLQLRLRSLCEQSLLNLLPRLLLLLLLLPPPPLLLLLRHVRSLASAGLRWGGACGGGGRGRAVAATTVVAQKFESRVPQLQPAPAAQGSRKVEPGSVTIDATAKVGVIRLGCPACATAAILADATLPSCAGCGCSHAARAAASAGS